MRQEDIMRILKAFPTPMAVTDIVDAHGVRDGFRVSDLNSTRDCLYSLERYGYVRRTGTRPSDHPSGRALILWEATA